MANDTEYPRCGPYINPPEYIRRKRRRTMTKIYLAGLVMCGAVLSFIWALLCVWLIRG